MPDGPSDSFLLRHDFLIRRLHSLSGLIPVGAYLVVHLLTNARVLDSPGAYQRSVYSIHALGSALLVVEWTLIFLPILFHAIVGVLLIRTGKSNTADYPYVSNVRYTLQRATGMIAFAFIVWHVFHMHGWLHTRWWIESVAEPLGGARFRAYNAASSTGTALQGFVVGLLYAVGVLACVFHLANGIWTMGITWGVWTSPAGQRRADWVCAVFGVLLAAVGLGALGGMRTVGRGEALQDARQVEQVMYESKIKAGLIEPDPHKRSRPAQLPDVAGTGAAAADPADPPAPSGAGGE